MVIIIVAANILHSGSVIARDSSVQRYVGHEPFLGVSRQKIRRKIKRWVDNQHLVLWRRPCSTQRQARELIRTLNWLQGP
jgi:hypothetical protein